jgi:phosphoglycerate dehydrogenase-like enzyme
MVDLAQLLRESDFVTVHVPLTPATDGLIGREALAMMKPTAFLINTARGRVVEEIALADALREGRLAGAALDVFATEPLEADSPLLSEVERTILTPHIGAHTDLSLTGTSLAAAESVAASLRGEWPREQSTPPIIGGVTHK